MKTESVSHQVYIVGKNHVLAGVIRRPVVLGIEGHLAVTEMVKLIYFIF